ncbi:SusD/RagB family nutrient-binding outer membrane lipoprotein [Tellurirhabdus bombi]|uniref:SusD/RagB family nutrient-binding outer membrane lipoprotein n=1 Tax=Tellurirhabdus bombi TaxID=2907205 RepID=UPI001F1EB86A|nr:SusD/RagB family nutrient-binding outer membrane lipoprotein [Tellurirhabdus bombi]
MIRQLKKSYFLVPLLLGFSGCSDFLDVNVTPNNPTAVTPAVLLPTVEAGAAFANANELNRFASVIVQQLAGAAPNSTPGQTDIYAATGSDFGNQWRFELYGGTLINAQKLIELGDANSGKAYSGIGKILKAYAFSIATDVWGDVPYSQALQGEANPQPRLDSQEDIYKGNAALGIQSLFDLVREGLNDLKAESQVKPGKDDLAYAGNLTKWEQAGNTLLLKLANTISRKEPALARTVINEVLTKGTYIKTNADDLNMPFGGSVGSQDPRYFYTNESLFKDDLILSTRYLNRLKDLNDPRLPILFTKPGTDYVTIDNGFRGTLPQPSTNWSRYNAYVVGANGEGPVRLLTNFQRAFILAESALILGTPGDPQALYTEGITASMTSAGLTPAQITTYLAANPTVATLTGTNAQKLEQIITQKYIAFTGNGLEIWNDVRRTGYPRLTASLNAAGIDGTPQVRAVYVTQEQERNPYFPNPGPQTNVRVWWDID